VEEVDYVNMKYQDITAKNAVENVYVNMEKENIDVKNVVEVKYVNIKNQSMIVLIVRVLIDVNRIIN